MGLDGTEDSFVRTYHVSPRASSLIENLRWRDGKDSLEPRLDPCYRPESRDFLSALLRAQGCAGQRGRKRHYSAYDGAAGGEGQGVMEVPNHFQKLKMGKRGRRGEVFSQHATGLRYPLHGWSLSR